MPLHKRPVQRKVKTKKRGNGRIAKTPEMEMSDAELPTLDLSEDLEVFSGRGAVEHELTSIEGKKRRQGTKLEEIAGGKSGSYLVDLPRGYYTLFFEGKLNIVKEIPRKYKQTGPLRTTSIRKSDIKFLRRTMEAVVARKAKRLGLTKHGIIESLFNYFKEGKIRIPAGFFTKAEWKELTEK